MIKIIETKIIVSEQPKLNNPIFVEGLPGIGNVGRVAVGYLIHQLKAKKFADLYSPYFFPFVIIHDDLVHTLRNEFYYYKNPKGRDLVLLIGDCQSYDPKGHYEISGKILDFVKGMGCKDVITIGGYGAGKVVEKPRVLGSVTDAKMIKEYEKFGINFKISDQVGTIVGASGLLVGLGKIYGMRGLCLLGETSGFPIITDPNSAEVVLDVLQKVLDIKIDMSKIQEKVKEMHQFIKKISELQEQAMSQFKEKKKPEELRYIG